MSLHSQGRTPHATGFLHPIRPPLAGSHQPRSAQHSTLSLPFYPFYHQSDCTLLWHIGKASKTLLERWTNYIIRVTLCSSGLPATHPPVVVDPNVEMM